MEGLSAAASGIAVFSIAIQLAESVKKLCDFWNSIKEAPGDIRAISTDLDILSRVLTQIADEAQNLEPDATLVAALESCSVRLRALEKLISDIEPGFSSKGLRVRKWTALKAVLKQGQVTKFQEALERLKVTLLLAQQNQSSHINRVRQTSLEQSLLNITRSVASLSLQQRSEVAARLPAVASGIHLNQTLTGAQGIRASSSAYAKNACQVPDYHLLQGGSWTRQRDHRKIKHLTSREESVLDCLLGTIRAKSVVNFRASRELGYVVPYSERSEYEHETSYIIYPAPWMIRIGIRCGLRLSFASGTQGCKHTLKPLYLVPDDALIFKFCAQGNVPAVKELLLGGHASVKDTNSKGCTPLHFAAQFHHPELCRILKNAGADLCAQNYRASSAVVLAAEHADSITPAEFLEVLETFRVLFDSMDFFEQDGAGWRAALTLCVNMYDEAGDGETKRHLLLEVMRLSSFEIMTNMIRRRYINLVYWLAQPEFMQLEGSAELLNLAGDEVIDEPLLCTDGYSILQWKMILMIINSSSNALSGVLSKSPDLHWRGFEVYESPSKESPMSLAMYHSRTFGCLLSGLIDNGVSLTDFVRDELEQNFDLHPGWEENTLLELLKYCVQDNDFFGATPNWACCQDCQGFFHRVPVQPYWRHLLERVRTRPHPCDLAGLHSEVLGDEDTEEEENLLEPASSDLERDTIERASLNDPVVLSASESESESGSTIESHLIHEADPHRYPNSVSVQSDCMYGRYEIVCMDCWLYYVRNGTRGPPPSDGEQDSGVNTLQSDGLSEDEYSPFHVHT